MRLPDICIELWDLEIGREYTDDLTSEAIEHKYWAERILQTSGSRLLEAMTDQHHPLQLIGFFGGKATAEDGLNTEEWKQVG
jgi:hypothetical protein